MSYAKCINNALYVDADMGETILPKLTAGKVYKILPLSQRKSQPDLIRVVDDSREAYLYPKAYFEIINYKEMNDDINNAVTIHISSLLKSIIQAKAAAVNRSMSFVLRQLIEDKLNLAKPPSALWEEPPNS